LSFLIFDLDHFKRVNDTLGHLAGDHVLRAICALVKGTLRIEDIFARYGGEEFAVICRETDLPDAHVLAERLRAVVEGHSFVFEGAPVMVTVSVGVARMPDATVKSASDLVAHADETMYKAKRSGRNRVCVRTPSPAAGVIP
jgi:diguanylate cyclase (GGDEF)-like protein